jgi:hypothetical protein
LSTGPSDQKQDAEERHARAAELKPRRQTVRLLGRDIPVLVADGGTLRSTNHGKPATLPNVTPTLRKYGADHCTISLSTLARL